MTALLPAPYGLGSKSIHSSIRAPNHESKRVREMVERFGCPKFVSVKVEACIRHSGRYDCMLMPDVDTDMLNLCLLSIGGSLEAIDFEEFEFESSHPSLSTFLMQKYGHWEFALDEGMFGLKFDVDYAAMRADGLKIAY